MERIPAKRKRILKKEPTRPIPALPSKTRKVRIDRDQRNEMDLMNSKTVEQPIDDDNEKSVKIKQMKLPKGMHFECSLRCNQLSAFRILSHCMPCRVLSDCECSVPL